MSLPLPPHEYCRVIIGCEEPIFYRRDLKPPFYLISWANIANVYPSTELNLVVEMAAKKAKCRLYPTMAEARDAYWAFCRRHHKPEPHECFAASSRQPLHRIMAFLPIPTTENREPLHLLVLSNEDGDSEPSEGEEEEEEEGLVFDDEDITGPNPLVYYPSPTYSPLPPSSPPPGFELPSSDHPPEEASGNAKEEETPSSPVWPTVQNGPSSSTTLVVSAGAPRSLVDVSACPTPQSSPGVHTGSIDVISSVSAAPLKPMLSRALESATFSVSSSRSITSAILAGEGPSNMDLFQTCNSSGPFFLVRLQSSRSFIFQSLYNAESVLSQFRNKKLWGCIMKCPGLIDCPDKLIRGDFQTLYYGVRGRNRFGVFVDPLRAQQLFDEETSIWNNATIIICPERMAALRWVQIPVDLGHGPLARTEVE